jgi:hypothetical protein
MLASNPIQDSPAGTHLRTMSRAWSSRRVLLPGLGADQREAARCPPRGLVRVEQRRDGSMAIGFREKYLRHELCERAPRAAQPRIRKPASGSRKATNAGGKSKWMVLTLLLS